MVDRVTDRDVIFAIHKDVIVSHPFGPAPDCDFEARRKGPFRAQYRPQFAAETTSCDSVQLLKRRDHNPVPPRTKVHRGQSPPDDITMRWTNKNSQTLLAVSASAPSHAISWCARKNLRPRSCCS